jgi:tRNA 2-thiocytidine biosynthesis protein TtcA
MSANPIKPPKSLLRQVGRAIADFDMIRDGDRILLGVSGGKDSLSLLQILQHLRTYAPVRFELAARQPFRISMQMAFISRARSALPASV